MKTTSAILKFYTLLVIALGLTQSLSAQSPVSPVGIQIITSYVPASAAVGESVLANLASDSVTANGAIFFEPLPITHIQFRTTIGLPVSAPVTYISPKLIRFTIPNLAITGTTTLMSETQLRSRVQPSFSVVALNRRLAGVSVINTAQWDIGSVKTGTTELLPANTIIPKGQAHFINRTLSSSTALPLDLTFVVGSTLTSPRQSLFTVRESVKLPRSSSSGTIAVSLFKRVDLMIEPFTVAEILRMGTTTTNARWKVFQRRFDRTMEVTPEGGIVLSQAASLGTVAAAPINLTIDEDNAEFSATRIRFSLKQGSRRSGEVITLYAPFDVFGATKLGPWRMEDELPAAVSPNVAPPPSADDLQPSPMLVRRVN